jgi:hypothetical protein
MISLTDCIGLTLIKKGFDLRVLSNSQTWREPVSTERQSNTELSSSSLFIPAQKSVLAVDDNAIEVAEACNPTTVRSFMVGLKRINSPESLWSLFCIMSFNLRDILDIIVFSDKVVFDILAELGSAMEYLEERSQELDLPRRTGIVKSCPC